MPIPCRSRYALAFATSDALTQMSRSTDQRYMIASAIASNVGPCSAGGLEGRLGARIDCGPIVP